jgi:hypothetical protein
MRSVLCVLILAAALALGACVPTLAPPPSTPTIATLQPSGWKAILIAGDDAEPAFDNAVDTMADKIVTFGIPRDAIVKLKADGRGAEAGTRENIESAFRRLQPAAGEACFVFLTSHGLPNRGLLMKRARSHVNPGQLSGLIDMSCRDHPTVIIASGCFSGAFAEGAAMPTANRVILTAARRDRPSFGCNANLRYTLFDGCILENLERGLAWDEVMGRTRNCVAVEESKLRMPASEPQLHVGATARELKVFAR